MKDMKGQKKDFTNIVEAVVFIPATPGNVLQKRLQRTEDKMARLKNSPKWMFVEQCGTQLKHILGNNTPWDTSYCGRTDCWSCSSREGKKMECRRESCTYVITCKICEKNKVETKYFGETSCNIYLRGNEHLAALRNEKEESVLWKHTNQEHPENIDNDKVNNFRIDLVATHRSAFNRQVSEGVLIPKEQL